MWRPANELDDATEEFALFVTWTRKIGFDVMENVKANKRFVTYFIGVEEPPKREQIILEEKNHEQPGTGDDDRERVDGVQRGGGEQTAS